MLFREDSQVFVGLAKTSLSLPNKVKMKYFYFSMIYLITFFENLFLQVTEKTFQIPLSRHTAGAKDF